MEKSYQDINAETINKWVAEGWEWGKPIDHQTFTEAVAGQWQVLLTPTKPVPRAWFRVGEEPLENVLAGKRILGLASGGGQQMPVFAAGGAICTVLDYAEAQCESERMMAEREGYQIDIVRADMTKPFPFPDNCFDIIFHPVSNCYIRETEPVWRECYRVLKPGGVLLAGLDMGWNYAIDESSGALGQLPVDPVTNEAQRLEMLAAGDGMQFSHTVTEQIGGQLKAGFRLTDLYEDTNGYGLLHERGIPSFTATRAIKP